MQYNWQQADWPEFRFDIEKNTNVLLYDFIEVTGHMSGVLKALPANIRVEAIINMMVSEAVKTSEIEGEYLNRTDVMSSIRNHLGVNIKKERINDRKAHGAGELMVAVRNSFAEPLTEKMLFTWHRMLMEGNTKISVGAWRSHVNPMQVVSGAIGKEKIHFEAPPSAKVPKEMQRFIRWFNCTAPAGKKEIKKAPVRSAIAHLYFESIHPFEDGNGRIGRAIAEKALAQTIGRPILLSLSQAIQADKKSYYKALEIAQRNNEITGWINYFIRVIIMAQLNAKEQIDFILQKSKFFDRFKEQLNDRQLKAIIKMMNAEPKGFKGGMTAKKYISLTKASKATATRDLQVLAEKGAFKIKGGGRSISYDLNIGE